MLGPVVELELANPLDKVPDGVEVSIRHFLTVPHSPEAHEALDNPEDEHQIVKLTKVEGRLEVQVIDSIQSVTSEYFSTRKLAGQSLCFVTMMFPINLCWHSSVKEIIFTKHAKKCSHEGYSLNVQWGESSPAKHGGAYFSAVVWTRILAITEKAIGRPQVP